MKWTRETPRPRTTRGRAARKLAGCARGGARDGRAMSRRGHPLLPWARRPRKYSASCSARPSFKESKNGARTPETLRPLGTGLIRAPGPGSISGDTRMAITRRFFLKSSGLALASFAAAPPFLQRTALAQTVGGAGRDRPIIIAIFQRGAADGVSMVVPFGDKSYSGARPQIAVPAPKAGDVDAAIDLDGLFGLHPALAPFKPLYSSGHLAVVHAVGSPDNTRSHFDAQDYMESGTPGSKSTPDGWLNRYIASKKDPKATPFRAVALSGNLPRTLMGKAPALAMTSISDFGVRAGAGNNQV